jgi:tetratricopeptide (TPR) repeat protein
LSALQDPEYREFFSHGNLPITCTQNLASLYLDEKQYLKAAPLFKKALAMHEAIQVRDREEMLCHEDYARLLRAVGKPDEASIEENRAKFLRDAIQGPKKH